jgi:hypothetical protein
MEPKASLLSSLVLTSGLIQSQMNPGHTIPYIFCQVHFNIILFCSSCPCIQHACLSHPPGFDHPSNIWQRVQIMELLTAIFYLFYFYNFPLLGSDILLSTLLSDTLDLCSYLSVKTNFKKLTRRRLFYFSVFHNRK